MFVLKKYINYGEIIFSNLLFEFYSKIDLNNLEFLFWLQLYRINKFNKIPNLNNVCILMNIDYKDGLELLNNLIKKKVLYIKTYKNSDGKLQDYYDFFLIFKKIFNFIKNNNIDNNNNLNIITKLYEKFELNFSRPLSSFELEYINYWINNKNYNFKLICLALKEAILKNIKNCKFIDRILFSWEQEQIFSEEEAIKFLKNKNSNIISDFKIKDNSNLKIKNDLKINLHNWLK